MCAITGDVHTGSDLTVSTESQPGAHACAVVADYRSGFSDLLSLTQPGPGINLGGKVWSAGSCLPPPRCLCRGVLRLL